MRFRKGSYEDESDSIPDEILVALCAVHHFYPEIIEDEKNWDCLKKIFNHNDYIFFEELMSRDKIFRNKFEISFETLNEIFKSIKGLRNKYFEDGYRNKILNLGAEVIIRN